MRSPRRKTSLRITQISNVWAKLADPKKDRDRLVRLLGYEQVWWRKGPFSKVRHSRWCSMVSTAGFFFAGFLPYLRERFDIELNDKRPVVDLDPLWKGKFTLRPYQWDAFYEVVKQWRGQICLPARTGKTVVAAAILSSLPGRRALFVVHTKDLLMQTVEEFQRFLRCDIGVVGDGQEDWKEVTIGMIQSLSGYSFKEHPVDTVIVDECHHSSADTYVELLKKIDCPVRIGLTATPRPDREGQLRVMGLLGPIIYDYSYQQAVADGWLNQARVRMLRPKVDMDTAGEIKGNYRNVYNKGIIENEERNGLIVREARRLAGEGKSLLIQVKETRHGRILEAMLDGCATYVLGESPSEERRMVKELLKSKAIKVCICNPIFEEGIDVPTLNATIIAGAGESEIKAIQRASRPITKSDGKDEVEIIDFFDSCHKYLRKHSRSRIKTYESKGWIVEEE